MSDTSQGPGWWLASDGKWYPPEQPPPADVAAKPITLRIAEEGRNGSVTIADAGLERVLKRSIGKDDRQFIPWKSISHVHHDRKSLGRDVVTLHVGMKSYEWKVKTDAEGFVDEVNRRISV